MSSFSRAGSHARLTRPSTAPRSGDRPPSRGGQGTNASPAAQPAESTGPMLFTTEQAAVILQVRPSWLRRKAAARAVPCRFVGKHLRFARADLEAIAEMSAQKPRKSP
ncbi:helix-turn-helix domain-containing protein [Amycolatopsis methanolica]|uniref:helix-turn-helix domain-containing protein n=1 Tax=Amycolatopsis methanolica TaxID=1814 RepID=UPI00342DDB3C